jgi:hypothetical protein
VAGLPCGGLVEQLSASLQSWYLACLWGRIPAEQKSRGTVSPEPGRTVTWWAYRVGAWWTWWEGASRTEIQWGPGRPVECWPSGLEVWRAHMKLGPGRAWGGGSLAVQ